MAHNFCRKTPFLNSIATQKSVAKHQMMHQALNNGIAASCKSMQNQISNYASITCLEFPIIT